MILTRSSCMPLYKECKQCKLDLPLSEFYPHPSTKDKLTPKCRTCTKENNDSRVTALKAISKRLHKLTLRVEALEKLAGSVGHV